MSNRTSHQAGFGTSVIIAGVLVVAVLGGIGFVVFNKSGDTKGATTSSTNPTPKDQVTPPSNQPEQPVDNPYEGMKQYTNGKYTLSFYYPADWKVEERDPQLTMDPEKTELSLWLVDSDAKENADTTVITVTARDIATMTKNLDSEITSHGAKLSDFKSESALAGRAAIKYTIPQGENVNRVRYYTGVGDRTYSISTIDERSNIDRDSNYVEKFNKVIESFKVQ